jgi:hypothetical protein
MSRKLTFNVIHLLRGAARQESLERLKREGHRSVSVLRSSDIESLLATAVDDTLAALGLELKEDTIRGLTEDARLRFVRLIKERDELKATLDALKNQGDQLALQSGTLRHELQRTESELHEEQAAAPTAPAAELLELRAQLTAQLSALLAGQGVSPAVVQETLALVEAAIENYRVLVGARVRREQEARIIQLQRRIEKLRHKLEESDVLLARARAVREEGVPFLTDIGPPLQPGDPGYAQKRELLEEIFKLNVELQRIIASTADTPTDPAARPEQAAATGAPPTA